MNNNILLNNTNAVFEPHIFNNNNLPFFLHDSVIDKCDYANFHENLELLYFKSGNGYVKCGKNIYNVKAGDVVVVNSYVTHQTFTDEKIERICLIIDNSFCKYNNIDVSCLCFRPLINDELLNTHIDKIVGTYKNDSEFKYSEIKCAVLNLLLFLCHNYNETDTQTPITYITHEYIRLSIEYIKSNLSKKITADSIATSIGLSKYHFLREFKKNTGYTLTNYINIIRCEYAKELLYSGKYTVKEVALLCSFDNFSYFTNVFKKHTGSLPSDYIKAKK